MAPAGTLDAETLDRRVRVWEGLLEREMAILVLELDGGLDGFTCFGAARDEELGEQTGELYALYLRAARHGVGLGRRLHDRALAGITDGGFREAVLWVIEANAPARRFYERAAWSLDDGVDASPMAWGLNETRYRRDIP